MKKLVLALLTFFFSIFGHGQSIVTIYPDSLVELIHSNRKPGVFFVPKTEEALEDFMGNGIYHNSIRTHVIESALNNFESLDDAIIYLESVESELVQLSLKCQKLVFIFEKMPVWLSSSEDASPAPTPGWAMLHTKSPENWDEWQSAVAAITALLIEDFGINNAYFEVWNEPDIGSWTDGNANYLELYKRTYDGIKEISPTIPVGGPTVNYWANNIEWQPIPGFIPKESADSSLISEVLEFGVDNGRIPDFISWHNFSLVYQDLVNPIAYIESKCEELEIEMPELLISEWNAQSFYRDTPLHKSYFLKGLYTILNKEIDNHMIAAWQDFEEGETEFHQDYGLVTFGGIHKPVYKAMLLANELAGAMCKIECTDPNVIISSAYEDTLYVLIGNYCPPAFSEALNITLQEGELNILDIVEAGYIDLELEDFTTLLDIFEGDVIIPDDTPVNIAVNNAIPTYKFYDSLASNPRLFELDLDGFTGTYNGITYVLDDQTNNYQYKYDSLILEGFSRSEATLLLQPNQPLKYTDITCEGGIYELALQPNAVQLIKLGISGVGTIGEFTKDLSLLNVYPNPSYQTLTIKGLKSPSQVSIYSINGNLLYKKLVDPSDATIRIDHFNAGTYLLQVESKKPIKFIVE